MLPEDPVRDQTRAALALLAEVLGDALLGAYRYGSAEAGGLHPDSDLDLMGVVARPTTDHEKRRLIEGLSSISRRRERPPSWRPLELTLVVRDEVVPWRWPPRFDLQYGEWLRAAFDAGELAPWPDVNPDVAVLLTMVRGNGRTLLGPPPEALLDPVPRHDLARAALDSLDELLADLASDTRNVLLTLGRMWVTLAAGEIRSKDAAAGWAAARLPEPARALVLRARDAYLAGGDEPWTDRRHAVEEAAAIMADAVRRSASAREAGADLAAEGLA